MRCAQVLRRAKAELTKRKTEGKGGSTLSLARFQGAKGDLREELIEALMAV